MKWIPGHKTELLPPIDNADYPKQYVVRIKGDDPHSGWIYIGHETAEEMRDINEDGYWEWLDESPSLPNESGLLAALKKIRGIIPEGEDYDPGQFVFDVEYIVNKTIGEYSSPSQPEEKEQEESILKEVDKIRHQSGVYIWAYPITYRDQEGKVEKITFGWEIEWPSGKVNNYNQECDTYFQALNEGIKAYQ